MNRLISLELHKLRTTPAVWVALVITVLLGGLSLATNALGPISPGDAAFGSTDHVNHALSVSALTSMVMLSIGVVMVAAEYRTRTIISTFLGTPQRSRVLLAKLATALGLGAVLGAVAFGLAWIGATLMYGSRGVHSLPVDLTQLWVGATVSSALFGLLGVALGALTRNTVTAIVGGIAWAMVIEIGILSNLAPEIGKWLPAGNALALTSVGSAGAQLLAPWVSAAVLTGWALALSAIATRLTMSREAH